MRGKAAKDGDTRTAPNGYHYTRSGGHWELTHRLVMEKHLGRKLQPGEQVRFKDLNKNNRHIDNLILATAKGGSVARQKARLRARIEELQGQLDDLEDSSS